MVGTVEDALAKLRRDEEPEDGLTEHDRMISGHGGSYVTIPYLTDAHTMKRIGGQLQVLASELVAISNRHEYTHRLKILASREAIQETNRRIREMAGKGRRKRPWETGDN